MAGPHALGPSSSDLESSNYDPLDHLNSIFSHPSTLSSAPAVSTHLAQRQATLNRNIHEMVTAQAASDALSLQRIRATQIELDALLSKIDGVRARALETEQTIATMTADIKRLDNTKRNLTVSMTALKRLQMLTTAFEQLRTLVKGRRYGECAQLLAAVMQLMVHFKSYRSIDQIAGLSRKVSELQTQLQEQISEEFEQAFSHGEVGSKKGMLKDACEVLDVLGDDARRRLISWYCNIMLREYRNIFRGNDEAGSLDNISRRYAWFNRTIKVYDAEHASIFPSHWHVNEMLANAFCSNTRDDYKAILKRSTRGGEGSSLDVNLLLSCLQETLDFEHSLERKFAKEGRSSFDTISSGDEKQHGFGQAISEAFEPYLSLWVDSQDQHLANLIPKYRTAPLRPPDEEFSPTSVIPSSTELFNFYRLSLNQCAKLSTGSRLLELTTTFSKYLDLYAQQVLFHTLSQATNASANNTLPSTPENLRDSRQLQDVLTVLSTADYCATTTNQLESKIKGRIDASLVEKVDLSNQSDTFVGVAGASIRALVTLTMTAAGLESSWREMRNLPWSRMEEVGDSSAFLSTLLTRLKDATRTVLQVLGQGRQQYLRPYLDNSVDAITATYIAAIGGCKPISEVGAEQMLLDSFSFKSSLNELPALAAADGSAQPTSKAIESHQRHVNVATSRIDPLLKTLQVRPDPPEALVQAYLIHLRDSSESNFRAVLDLKGISKRAEIGQLVELFNAHKTSPRHAENLLVSAPVFGLLFPAGQVSGGTSSASNQNRDGLGIGGVSTGPTSKFDPSNFTSSLFNAAREGVDRFSSSPHLGAGTGSATGVPTAASPPTATSNTANAHDGKVFGGGSGMAQLIAAAQGQGMSIPNTSGAAVTSPDSGSTNTAFVNGDKEKTNVGENLRNLGRFFKRPEGGMSGAFGRFGRGGNSNQNSAEN